ncbi:unnamed protein product [Nippostrongylus brasiliensis]|uniref:Ion_trans domain-containing protein n=1 Tax=Nippostrongylus brasiliensis TaxID=27835 RepID=A0A0N4XCY6_NIPBR|nr:unnamed protein product [Nippostrongylus brasiliensis]
MTVGANLPRMRPIKIRRRLYEFYTAPITTFWAWTLSFCLFLCALTYVLLVRTPPKPSWLEWLLFAYVIAFGMEHLRKFLMSEMEPLGQKIKYFFYSYWNTVTTIAVITFIIGFAMRTFGVISSGRVVLACNSVLWTMKLLDYMSVHPRLGPYITMAGKMILNMSYIIVMLVVSLLAFGLARQSITFPNEDWHWLLVRNIFYKPYFMLYGEVYADEIDNCGDEAWDAHLEKGLPITNSTFGDTCVPGYWIPPVLMTFFLLVANILLMSMLIAIFNHIFDQTDEIAQQIWLFQRYRQVMEYESTPFIPPPFTPISHAALAIRYIKVKVKSIFNEKSGNRDRKIFDFSLKLFLNDDQVEKLHDFEEDCMDDLAREKELRKRTSNEERILRTAERTDMILNRLNDIASKEVTTRETVTELDNRLLAIEKTQGEILDCLRTIMTAQMSSIILPDEKICVDTALVVSDADLTEGVHPGPVGQRRHRTNTVCGLTGPHGSVEDPALLSPRPNERRYGSMLSLDPSNMPQAKLIGSVRRQRHGEYTSITDSISIQRDDRARRQRRSMSNDHQENHSGVIEEEELADCELTDVLTEGEAQDSDDGRDGHFEESTDGSKIFMSLSIVDEQNSPHPSPRAPSNSSAHC